MNGRRLVSLGICLVSFALAAAASLSATLPPPCVADAATLCLDDLPGDQRYQLRMTYETVQGGGLSGSAHAVPLVPAGFTRGGAFWFFSPENPEVLVKVLDGCAVNQRHWLLASATTNVGYRLVATDTLTGAEKVYTNADRTPALPIQDTAAFDCADPCTDPDLATHIDSFTATPTVAAGSPQTFQWTFRGAGPFTQALTGTELTNVQLWPGDRSYTFAPQIPGAHEATLAVHGRCGSDRRAVSYDVQPVCVAPQVVSFTTQYPYDSSTFCAGDAATLSWQTSGSGEVSISPGIGAVVPSGSITVPANATTSYTLTKTAACGTASATLDVSVAQRARIVSFTADDSALPCFGRTTLRFDVEGDGIVWWLQGGNIIRPTPGSGAGPHEFIYEAGGFCQQTVTIHLYAYGTCPLGESRDLSIDVR